MSGVQDSTGNPGEDVGLRWKHRGPLLALAVAMLLLSTEARAQSPWIFSSDLEGGTLLQADTPAGSWNSISLHAPNTATVSSEAAHRGAYGLRFTDSDTTAGPEFDISTRYVTTGLSGNVYFRAWFRLTQTSSSGEYLIPVYFFSSATPHSGTTTISIPRPSWSEVPYVGVHGWDMNDVGPTQTSSTPATVGTWVLIELAGLGYGTANGERKAWVNGSLVAATNGANWVGVTVDALYLGLAYVGDRVHTGLLDFDDVRLSTAQPASTLVVAADETLVPQRCTKLTVSLLGSDSAAAPAPYDLALTLSATGVAGNFYADSSCAGPVQTNASIGTGVSSTKVYFLPQSLGLLNLRAVHTDFISKTATLPTVTGKALEAATSPLYAAAGSVKTLTAVGGSGLDYRWTLSSNPSGGSLSADGIYSAGTLTGVIDVAEVKDSLGATAQVQIQVIPPPRFLSSPLESARCGSAYRYSEEGVPHAEGTGTLTFSAQGVGGGPLPEGIAVDSATGAVTWTPARAQTGAQDFELVVTDLGGSVSQPIHVAVDCPQENVAAGCACDSTGAAGSAMGMLAMALAGARKRLRAKRSR